MYRNTILAGYEREALNRKLRDAGYECVERLTDSEAERLLARVTTDPMAGRVNYDPARGA